MAYLHLCHASAGAGKTHALVANYLRFALVEKPHFSAILAITFTRKATQEMKQRILEALESLAQGRAGSLREVLISDLGLSPTTLQKRAQVLFHAMFDRYDDFRVMTLDRFLHQLVDSFGNALGLPPDYELSFDPKKGL